MEFLADLIPLAVAALNLASVLINRKSARRHRHPAHGEDKGGCQSLGCAWMWHRTAGRPKR